MWGTLGRDVNDSLVPNTAHFSSQISSARQGKGNQPHEAGSSDRSPQSSSRSHVQEMGMHRPLAQEYWLGGQVRAEKKQQIVKVLLTARGHWRKTEFVYSTRASGIGLVFVVPAVIVAIAQPAQRNAAVILALKSVRGASVLVWSERQTE